MSHMTAPMTMEEKLSLVAPGLKPRVILFLLAAALPLGIIAAATLWDTAGNDAGVAIADNVSAASLTMAGTGLFIVSLWLLLHLAMKRHRLELDGERLRVATSFYTRKVALSELLLDSASVVDLHERPEFKPSMKSNGYALPGFQSGHFQLGNGNSAFVAIVGGQRALWLPTRSGKGLLLQPHRPEALLERLREVANAHARG